MADADLTLIVRREKDCVSLIERAVVTRGGSEDEKTRNSDKTFQLCSQNP
jgi:hypothetical protein